MEHNWVNIFFLILIIVIVIVGICWFFSWHVPNYKEINRNIEKSKIPTTYNLGINCTDRIIQYWKAEGITPGGWRGTMDDADGLLRGDCAIFCGKQSVGIGTLNSILVESNINHPYDCDNNTNDLICNCKVY